MDSLVSLWPAVSILRRFNSERWEEYIKPALSNGHDVFKNAAGLVPVASWHYKKKLQLSHWEKLYLLLEAKQIYFLDKKIPLNA